MRNTVCLSACTKVPSWLFLKRSCLQVWHCHLDWGKHWQISSPDARFEHHAKLWDPGPPKWISSIFHPLSSSTTLSGGEWSSSTSRHGPHTPWQCYTEHVCFWNDLPQWLGTLVNKSLMVCTDALVADWRKNAHLIECVLLFFIRKFAHFDFLQCIGLIISIPAHMIHRRVGTLT